MTSPLKTVLLTCAAAMALAQPAAAQRAAAKVAAQPALPGAPLASRVVKGTYKAEPNHTQVIWTVNHMGLTPLSAAISSSEGTLEIDPAHLDKARVQVTFKVADMSTTVPEFAHHLMTDEILDAAKYPTITFVSTKVVPKGMTAVITGNLTVHGVTRPVTLSAQFFGAGINPRSKALTLGFTAKGKVKRSEFGLTYAPVVGDTVDLDIRGNFEKVD